MHIRVRTGIEKAVVLHVESVLITIDDFRDKVKEKFHVDPDRQRLLFRGRELENGRTFHDYQIKQNDTIQLICRVLKLEKSPVVVEKQSNVTEEPRKKFIDSSESKFYRVGDLIDAQDVTHGAWFEGKIVRIVKNPEELNVDICDTVVQRDDLLYLVKFNSSSDEEPIELKLPYIRPRARTKLDIENLQPGQMVMVNYNTDDPKEKGYWYDLKISSLKVSRKNKQLIGTLYIGHDRVPEENCKVTHLDAIYKCEPHQLLSSRSDNDDNVMKTETEPRYLALNCLKCRDDASANCNQCGCSVCSKKDQPESIILCDECDKGYHCQCLNPPLDGIPDDDQWYCPNCKTDVNSIVNVGSNTKQKVRTTNSTRDWGRGMACAGRTKTCTIVAADHFGAIPGVPVGTCWKYRMQASEAGVHRPPVSGIHGKSTVGAFSLVLAAGYEDDKDNGLEFTYTGSGGRDLSGNKRTSEQDHDQKLTRENAALALNCNTKLNQDGATAKDWKNGKPVRVIRSEKLNKHNPKYAPKEGLRYDGIYKVVKYWPQKGQSGFKVWRYLLRRDDPTPAPWEKNGITLPIIYPDNYLQDQAEKLATKRKKSPVQKSPNENGKIKRKKLNDCSEDDAKSNVNKQVAIPEHRLTPLQIERIHEDKINVKLWDICLKELPAGEKKFVETIQETFTCLICQEICVAPITTPCLHNMCQKCMKRSFAAEVYNCPYCRYDLTKQYKFETNVALYEALKSLLPGYNAR